MDSKTSARNRQRRRREKLRKQGKCPKCASPVEEGFIRCAKCRKKDPARAKTCVICSRPFFPYEEEVICSALLCEIKHRKAMEAA